MGSPPWLFTLCPSACLPPSGRNCVLTREAPIGTLILLELRLKNESNCFLQKWHHPQMSLSSLVRKRPSPRWARCYMSSGQDWDVFALRCPLPLASPLLCSVSWGLTPPGWVSQAPRQWMSHWTRSWQVPEGDWSGRNWNARGPSRPHSGDAVAAVASLLCRTFPQAHLYQFLQVKLVSALLVQ